MTDLDDAIDKKIDSSGLMKKEDYDSLLNATRDVTIGNVMNHKDCGDKNCSTCSMKNQIDESAFSRGLKKGIYTGQKFPTEKFSL